MDLFTSDRSVQRPIAGALVTCGCCARCVLRYLGLKDMHSYRRNTQDMEKLVEEITGSQKPDPVVSRAGSLVTQLPDPAVSPVSSQVTQQTDTKAGMDGITGSTMLSKGPDSPPSALISPNTIMECTTDSLMEVDIPDTASESVVRNRDTNNEQAVEEIASPRTSHDASNGTGQVIVETDNPSSLQNVATDTLLSEECGSSKTRQSNSTAGDNGAETVGHTDIDISQTETDAVRSSSVANTKGSEKSDGSGDRGSTAVSDNVDDCKKAPCCVVCLGILKEFSSAEFLDQIKSCSRGAGFEFSSYICSLKIPVSIILREHAMLLFLKEKFKSIFEDKTMANIASVKDVWKWRNGPELREVLAAPFDQKSSFDITLSFVYKDSNKECNFLLDVKSDIFRNRKQDRRYRKKSKWELFTRGNVEKAAEELSDDNFRSNFQCPPTVPGTVCHCDMKCHNEPIFIAGRYNKYSRVLSQTPWIIDGTRKSESSVEELICTDLDKNVKPDEHKFSSSGREDVDVLMLGNGRPFVIEMVNPKKLNFSQEEITSIQKTINESTEDIKIQDLQIVSRASTDYLKEGEIDKVKTYSALCWSASIVTEDLLGRLPQLKDLKILQKTPIRVLHRRPLATRDKLIHSMSVVKVDEHHFRVTLSSQAGTYIKEFVHGDFGRTRPSMSNILGVDCDIVELDVESVELDWPKKLG